MHPGDFRSAPGIRAVDCIAIEFGRDIAWGFMRLTHTGQRMAALADGVHQRTIAACGWSQSSR